MNKPVIFNSAIREDVVFGVNVKVVQPVNLYGCTIADHCFIGPFVEVQKSVRIGKRKSSADSITRSHGIAQGLWGKDLDVEYTKKFKSVHRD